MAVSVPARDLQTDVDKQVAKWTIEKQTLNRRVQISSEFARRAGVERRVVVAAEGEESLIGFITNLPYK